MMTTASLSFLISGIIAGVGLTGLLALTRSMRQKNLVRRAQETAEALIADAKEEAENLMDEAKLSADELKDELWEKVDSELKQLESRIEELEEGYRKKRSQADRAYNQDTREIQKQNQALLDREKKMAERQERFAQIQVQNRKQHQDLIDALKDISGVDPEVLKQQLAGEFEHQTRVDAKRKAQSFEDEVRSNSEEIAQRLIGIALSRFHRPSCTERGIGIVEIPNDDVKKRMLGPEGRNIAKLQELCNLEISVSDANTFQVQGFDPVGREVATRSLEKLLHERAPTEETVQRIYEKTQSDVQRKIESDGNRVAAELGQKDLNIEIKRMLGVLRYRYSFAQNQHFHVAEVGWLCGLLASELGSVHVPSARRAGLLHDVGKAMDHNQEGGHAVLGADFIQKNGEKEEIVHAVRAHHYEEQPSTDLAFLVIAADAISGARPGARRQTVSIYNQKIEALSSIADGFKGVQKTLVFNAGREVRIIVDGRRINDEKALKLCREIADKIEDECQYPGQIKVVVVRETHAEAMAK
jgi:ribonuclease Y